MPKEYRGDLTSSGHRFAIVVSQYNESVTSKLLTGAVETFAEHGVSDGELEIAWVPGGWEIPLVADHFARSETVDAVVCLGAVIRGETTHDQHINRHVSLSLGQMSLVTGVPVLFGVLTCNSLEQAIQRSGGSVGNKGAECAEAALQMANLLDELPKP
ncbi:MAG: 6,7-dimethyl-8-ribityllumazine synthase [Pirellulaceae bacterium]